MSHYFKNNDKLLDSNRDVVNGNYNEAEERNRTSFMDGDVKASSEYIYNNQKEDACIICHKLLNEDIRVVSIVKRTKVGMDGLMIEIAKKISTHPDNNKIIHRDNVFFITAMSNLSWEDDLKVKMPDCFIKNIYHHGKLQKLKRKLTDIKNAVIIIDEIDCGDKEDQKLDRLLKGCGLLDIKIMEENNIKFVFVSATMINELRDLYKWGNKHYTYFMTIPDNYIGHKDFLELNIIQEYYPIKDEKNAEKWIQEDIIKKYGLDFRVHIIRSDEKNIKYIQDACKRNRINFKNHTSTDRISHEELLQIFNNIPRHIVIAVKGFYRRANLIPNEWKLKIGATHEMYVKKGDMNVQVQGLPGRMTGYWKREIQNGHITGPYRTSKAAIEEYEDFIKNPDEFYKLYVRKCPKKLLVDPTNIKNLKPVFEETPPENLPDVVKYRVYDNETVAKEVCKILKYRFRSTKPNSNGFKETSLNCLTQVVSLTDAILKVPSAYGYNKGEKTKNWRTSIPCYVNIKNNETLRVIIIIKPETDINSVNEIDTKYPSLVHN